MRMNTDDFIDILTIETENNEIKQVLDCDLKQFDKCDFHEHYQDHHHDHITETQHYHISKRNMLKAQRKICEVSKKYPLDKIFLILQFSNDEYSESYSTPFYIKVLNGELSEPSEIKPT